jgi:hypothetical protein
MRMGSSVAKKRKAEGIQDEGIGSRATSSHLGEHLIQITETRWGDNEREGEEKGIYGKGKDIKKKKNLPS